MPFLTVFVLMRLEARAVASRCRRVAKSNGSGRTDKNCELKRQLPANAKEASVSEALSCFWQDRREIDASPDDEVQGRGRSCGGGGGGGGKWIDCQVQESERQSEQAVEDG
jgi:hypothetical protein